MNISARLFYFITMLVTTVLIGASSSNIFAQEKAVERLKTKRLKPLKKQEKLQKMLLEKLLT